jgi:large conductance mechanosensitive channel
VLQDLKKFLLRGNIVDLAVAVIIGAAFTLVVTSFVNDIVMAIVGAIVGEPNFDDLSFTIGDGVVYYGRFLTTLVNFVLVGTVIFFLLRAIQSVWRRDEEPEKTPKEVELLTEIRDELRARR